LPIKAFSSLPISLFLYQLLPILEQNFGSFRGELLRLRIGFQGIERGYLLGCPSSKSEARLSLYLLGDGEVVGFF